MSDHQAEFNALTGVLADEIRMYAHAHGSWLPIDLARNLTKQLQTAGWSIIPPGRSTDPDDLARRTPPGLAGPEAQR